MEVIAWIFVGIVVGIIAKLILRDYSAASWLLTIILGVIGAVAGGFISATIVLATDNRWEIGPVSTTMAGAVGLLMVHRIIEKY